MNYLENAEDGTHRVYILIGEEYHSIGLVDFPALRMQRDELLEINRDANSDDVEAIIGLLDGLIDTYLDAKHIA